MPRDEQAGSIVETYWEALQERGFELQQHVGTPSTALFAKNDGRTCEVILMGSPYLEPEQRASTMLIEFQYNRGPAEQCAS